ncbi:MAG: SGNH/GDSL hydrolase family protein [Saprospiraceae bacterium]
MSTRRAFLCKSALAAFAAATIPSLVKAANETQAARSGSSAGTGSTILFQGDSITDAGRNRGQYYANDAGGMGGGYARHIVTHLLGSMPGKNFRFYNRGISGNKVFQLAARWEDDCLQLQPDVLSILIGVNDFWHTLSGGYTGTVETYETDFRQLLERTKKALPEVKLIIGEPFAVAGGSAIGERWEAFAAYREAAQKIASSFGAVFLPYQSIFDKALKLAPSQYWAHDGVHPSMAGSYLMAEAWLAGFKKLGE